MYKELPACAATLLTARGPAVASPSNFLREGQGRRVESRVITPVIASAAASSRLSMLREGKKEGVLRTASGPAWLE